MGTKSRCVSIQQPEGAQCQPIQTLLPNPQPATNQPWFARLLDESRPWRSRTLLPLKQDEVQFAYRRKKDAPVTCDTYKTFAEAVQQPEAARDTMVATPNYPRWFPAILLWEPKDSGQTLPLETFAKPLLFTLALGIAFLMRDQILPRGARDMDMMLLLGLMWLGIMPLCDTIFRWLDSIKDRSPDRQRQQQVDIVLFQRWLAKASSWILYTMLTVLVVVFLIQIQTGVTKSVDAAALYKPRLAQGEWWRLITTGLMHGDLMHLLFNGAAVYYLGKVTVSLVKAPLLGIIFFASVLVGSLASYQFMPGLRSVGASGGILGILGFLTMLAVYHDSGFPRIVRANLLQSILLMAIFGALGARYIDNAAHAGGFVMGAVLAVILIPRNVKVWEYQAPKWIQMIGWGCWAALALATAQVLRVLLT